MKKIKKYKNVFVDLDLNIKLLIVLILGLLLISGISLLIPIYLGDVVDLIVNNEQKKFYQISFMILFLYLVKYIIAIFVKRKFVCIGQDVNQKLQMKLLRKSLKLKMEYFDFHEKGYVLSRIGEANSISGIFSPNVISIVIGIVDLIIAIFAIFKMDFKMSLVVIMLIPLYYFTISKYTKSLKNITTRTMETNAFVSSESYEIISNISEIKILNKFDKHIKKYTDVFIPLKKLLIKQGKTMVMYLENTQMLSSLVTIVVLLISGYSIFNGEFTLGMYTSFAAFSNRIFGNVQSIASIGITLNPILVSLNRVSEYLNYEEENTFAKIKFTDDIDKIIFNNISFSYPTAKNIEIIHDFNLTINSGDKIWITGDNGKGKTTLIKLLLGLYHPNRGSINVNEYSINDIDKDYLRDKIAVVSQNATIFKGTVKENILYGLEKEKEVELNNLISKYSLYDYMDSFIKGLETEIMQNSRNISGGQNQLITLIRALLMKKEILILDEPTSSLDKNIKKLVADMICDYTESKIIIMISHDSFMNEHAISKMFIKIEIR